MECLKLICMGLVYKVACWRMSKSRVADVVSQYKELMTQHTDSITETSCSSIIYLQLLYVASSRPRPTRIPPSRKRVLPAGTED